MILIIGAGISGATIAERYATMGKKVLVLDKRHHIGGNCHDFYDDDGLLVPLYGPHFFHTNLEHVWEYVQRFSSWTPYEHRVLSSVDGKLVPVPVNITTVNEVFGLSLQSESEMKAWLDENTEKIANPANSEESAMSRVGRVLYEKMFKNYTKKQWDLYPHQLDAQVMNRIPVRTNFEDRYFTDTYQAMPENGYTELFKNMLDHPNIEVRLDTDYFEVKNELPEYEKLFFTGRIDQFFAYQIDEKLEYRSLRFEFETIDQEWYQQTATINYPNEYEYTRITEPKHSTRQKHNKTVIIREYPTWEGEPYYPVFNPRNHEIYAKYQTAAQAVEKDGVFFVGRLANYKYFNMDAAFNNALQLFDSLQR
jgi:UDP-galactopyranose mutase